MAKSSAQLSGTQQAVILAMVLTPLVGIMLWLQTGPDPAGGPGRSRLKQGRFVPDFALPQLGGGTARLSDYRGKVVFLNIWATWCKPCRDEMPSMEALYQALKGEPFEILAVSIDAEGARAVAPFMAAYKLTFPALLDPAGEIPRLYGTTGIPESFIIDRDGRLALRIIGPRDWAGPDAIDYIRSLIQKPAAGTS